MPNVSILLTIITDGQVQTLDLDDCTITIECGTREVAPTNGFVTREATEDIAISITGKRTPKLPDLAKEVV